VKEKDPEKVLATPKLEITVVLPILNTKESSADPVKFTVPVLGPRMNPVK
jgi:hypothetical protein